MAIFGVLPNLLGILEKISKKSDDSRFVRKCLSAHHCQLNKINKSPFLSLALLCGIGQTIEEYERTIGTIQCVIVLIDMIQQRRKCFAHFIYCYSFVCCLRLRSILFTILSSDSEKTPRLKTKITKKIPWMVRVSIVQLF